jgi:hypothetical protein
MRIQFVMLIAAVGFVAYASAEVAGTSVPAGAAAGTPRAIPEVNVIAKRLKLDVKVLNFIYGISALENEEGLARWKAPVCPLVSGLPRQQGEFVLARISQIARAAAVPLAGEECRPNLFIFVTTQPKELLQAMENRYSAVTFGDASPSQVDAFINAPRPVRVWHGSYETPARIGPSVEGLPGSAQVLGGGMRSQRIFTTHDPPSRLVSNIVWTFGLVYVVADETQLHGVSQGQFADYVAMVSLAEIKPSPHPGNAQTILKLFAGIPQAAPAGMSDWDQAYLKSLYATARDSKLQRSLMMRSMVRELVP